jgi:hypothetical protein
VGGEQREDDDIPQDIPVVYEPRRVYACVFYLDIAVSFLPLHQLLEVLVVVQTHDRPPSLAALDDQGIRTRQ